MVKRLSSNLLSSHSYGSEVAEEKLSIVVGLLLGKGEEVDTAGCSAIDL